MLSNWPIDPLTEDQVKSLTYETKELERVIAELTEKRDNMDTTADGQIRFYRNRASAMEKKKQELAEQLEELEDDRKDHEKDLRQLQADLKALAIGGEMPKSDAQMKAYFRDITKKTEVYKAKKAELQAAFDEGAVLRRTEEILRSRVENIQEFNEHLAAEKGVQGYQQTQDTLEQIATTKQTIDTNKGQTLDEISAVVANIVQTLKARKNKLAPQIKELRAIRSKYEEVEAEYTKKKKAYDNMVLSYESERLKLEQDVEANVTGILEDQSAHHFVNCLSGITQVRLDQMSQELMYQLGDEKLSDEYKSYREMYEKTIEKQEQLAKKLRQEKITIKDQHGDNIQQRSMFLNLRKIMQCKAEMQKVNLTSNFFSFTSEQLSCSLKNF